MWVEWNTNGKQNRHPVRDAAGQPTSSWSEAEKLAGRNTETTGNPAVAPKGADAVTVEKAIKLFLESKQGEDLSHNTIVKHKLTLRRLKEYCDGEGITLLADVTLPVLASWRAGWTYKAPIAKRNNQERVRAFFRFCLDGELISKNPAVKLSKIQVKDNEKDNVKAHVQSVLKVENNIVSTNMPLAEKIARLNIRSPLHARNVPHSPTAQRRQTVNRDTKRRNLGMKHLNVFHVVAFPRIT